MAYHIWSFGHGQFQVPVCCLDTLTSSYFLCRLLPGHMSTLQLTFQPGTSRNFSNLIPSCSVWICTKSAREGNVGTLVRWQTADSLVPQLCKVSSNSPVADTVRDLQVSLAELGPAAAPVTRLKLIRRKEAEKLESREMKDEK